MKNYIKKILLSFYSHVGSKTATTKTLHNIFQEIESGTYKKQVLKCRELYEDSKKEYDIEKTKLPAFTFNGVFKETRKGENLTSYSKIMVLDIDKLSADEIDDIKSEVERIDYTLAVAISPSGRGLKIFVKTTANKETHKVTFERLAEYYQNIIDCEIDQSGKDLARLCFMTFDTSIYTNLESKEFDVSQVNNTIQENTTRFLQIKNLVLFLNNMSDMRKFSTEQLGMLSTYCNKYGLPKQDAYVFIKRDFKFGNEKVQNYLDSAYSNKDEFNSWILLLNNNSTPISLSKADKNSSFSKAKDYLQATFDFRYNEVLKNVEYKPKGSATWHEVDDRAEDTMYSGHKMLGSKINLTDFRALLRSAEISTPLNPFQQYFDSIKNKWKEGSPDYISEMAGTITTTKQEFWIRVFKKWIVAVVRCLLNPEDVNHTAIIFQGDQGLGKTTWIRNLLPKGMDRYFYEGAVDLKGKDSLILLSTMWFISMEELENMTRGEQGELKRYITQQFLNLRRSYGRNHENWIRRASFIGSVNDPQVLNDTQTRRFPTFEVIKIDNKHNIPLDLLYSQAYHLAQDSNFRYWFEDEEIEEINKNNEFFKVSTIEEDILLKNFEPADRGNPESEHLTATEILSRMSELVSGVGNFNTGNAINVGKLLKKHNYTRAKSGGVYGYYVRQFSEAEVRENQQKAKKEIKESDKNLTEKQVTVF